MQHLQREDRGVHMQMRIFIGWCVRVWWWCMWAHGFMSLCFHGQTGTVKLYRKAVIVVFSHVMRNYCTVRAVSWRWGVMILLHTKLFAPLLGLSCLLGCNVETVWLNTVTGKKNCILACRTGWPRCESEKLNVKTLSYTDMFWHLGNGLCQCKRIMVDVIAGQDTLL